tara:strand:+ start:747 stop:920 length:174 start_codon:yes stop_codon:yes gene_type:complete
MIAAKTTPPSRKWRSGTSTLGKPFSVNTTVGTKDIDLRQMNLGLNEVHRERSQMALQ